MPPVLTDYTYAIGETGFVLNTDFVGTLPFVDVTGVAGLDTAPFRVNTTEREGADGTYVDALFQSMRTVVITANVYANTFDADTVCDILRSQYSNPTVQPFYFKHPGKPIRFVNAQGGGAQYSVDVNRRIGVTPIQLSLLCGDPYIYDYPANFSAAAPTVFSGVGLNFNNQVNFLTGNATGFESGIANWTNTGNCAISRSTVQAHTGVGSLALTSAAAGTMGASSCTASNVATQGLACSAGDSVTVSAWFFASTVARSIQVGAQFYDITGTSLGSAIFGSSTTDSITVWTQSLPTVITAPANAVWCRPVVQVLSTGAGSEVHYVDDVFIAVNGLGFNVGFGSSITPTQVAVQNSGTHVAYPIIRIYGPQINPIITDSNSSLSMRLTLTMGVNDVLVIDCRNKSITLNGVLSVRSAYAGMIFFTVPPTVNDTFYLQTGTGSYSVTLYNTYY